MKIGVLGGTFDPIHLGHIAAARAALRCAHLDLILVMPSASPPHRSGAVASAQQRLDMCRLAVDGEPGLEVSDLEVVRGGDSYTVDTLEQLRRDHPDDDLYLILGWDAAALFKTWHEPARVRQLASVVVVGRPGVPAPDPGQLSTAGLDVTRTIVCLDQTPDISGSALRHAIQSGGSIAGKLPRAVERYIALHNLYSDNRDS